jgi:uncharacterized repeat protein (TIGR01451 family)
MFKTQKTLKKSTKAILFATLLILLASLALVSATVVLLIKEHHPTPSAFKDPSNLYDGYLPGDTITFHGHLNVTNTVQDPTLISIKDLNFTDQLPAGLTYVPGSATSLPAAIFTDFGGGMLFWDFGPGPFATLQADFYQASIEFQATVDLTVPDNTYLVNSVTPRYLETVTNALSEPTTTDTIYVARPILDIEKTCTEKIIEGGAILYQITLTNTGHYPAESIEVTDMLPAGVIYTLGTASATSGVIDDTTPGQIVWTGTIGSVQNAPANVVMITIPVVDDGTVISNSLVNTVSYTEFPAYVQFINDDDTCTTTVIHPAIDIVKDASPAKILAGTDVTYTFTVTNIGDVTLENIEVVDDVLGNIGVVASLASGANVQFVVVTAVNVDTTNTATVTADYQLGTVTDMDTAMVEVISPAIMIEKDASPAKILAGTEVTYTFTVTNTGDVTLENIEVVDDILGNIGVAASLASGAVVQFVEVVSVDVDTTNTATVTADYQLGSVSDSDTAMVDVINPAIEVTKTCEATIPTAPGEITWTITVTNTGDVDLDVTVIDSEHGNVFAGTIAAGANEVIVIVDSNLAAGTYTDTVTAEGVHQLGTVSDTDVATCEIEGAFEGLTPGFWKNNAVKWGASQWADPYTPAMTLAEAGFVGTNYQDSTMLEALNFKGGPGVGGAQQILLRAAVAALLNAAHPEISYPLTEAEILAQVNAAIASGDRETMLELAAIIDGYNNLGADPELPMNGSWN